MDRSGDAMGAPAMMMRAVIERKRAARAASIARDHERQAEAGNASRAQFHQTMAGTHRSAERRHLAAADMHADYAVRVLRWDGIARDDPSRPRFVDAIARASGRRSTAIALYPDRFATPVTAAADHLAEAAQDLEALLGEGPGSDLVRGGASVEVVGDDMTRRWPQFGPAVAELGVRSLVSARLGTSDVCLGAVTCYDDGLLAEPPVTVGELQAVADALLYTALVPTPDGTRSHPLLQELDFHSVVHQAAGMLAGRHRCTPLDGLALMRAHAFAMNLSLSELAADIVNGSATLD